ncbi:hypothetical protein SAMN05444266_104102 [Chitinophaga jiangningensis]|uniref:DUF1735 domain-containing protein n=1 Tax=Chitinophaga jiangningensis TaxID=1419482 RepID=A0A1M7BWD4_9BACT|nr:hypothetical protein [Chitinophaga jiangningensis]SHL59264.1 hypothetical protein SAMN05444266_104102 [Chitinophaga jiangningensis]
MKKHLTFIAGAMILASAFYACKKNDQPTAPGGSEKAWTGETQTVKLNITGDLVVMESPLGGARKSANARINSDSVLYAVDVRVNYAPFSQGILKRLDTVSLEIPKGVPYTIQIAAIKPGSGLGLYSRDTANLTKFEYPIERLTNFTMTKDTYGPFAMTNRFMDTLNYFTVARDSSGYDRFRYSELDLFWGQYYGSAADSAKSSININMRRLTFGVKFEPVNFPGGTLIVDYSGQAAPRYLPVTTANQKQYLFSSDRFKFLPDSLTETVYLQLLWRSPDGTLNNFGTKPLNVKRNTLTTVRITAPSNSSLPVSLNIFEQSWKKDTVVVW